MSLPPDLNLYFRIVHAKEKQDNYERLVLSTHPQIQISCPYIRVNEQKCRACQVAKAFFPPLVEAGYVKTIAHQAHKESGQKHPEVPGYVFGYHKLVLLEQEKPILWSWPPAPVEKKPRAAQQKAAESDKRNSKRAKKKKKVWTFRHFATAESECRAIWKELIALFNVPDKKLRPAWNPMGHQRLLGALFTGTGHCPTLHPLDTCSPYAQVPSEFQNLEWARLPAVWLDWKMGSGKTESIWFALLNVQTPATCVPKKVLVLCPKTMIPFWRASLKNVPIDSKSGIHQHGLSVEVMGYQRFRKWIQDSGRKVAARLTAYHIVIDESHYYRNLTPEMLWDVFHLAFSRQTVCASGTLALNDSEDVLGALALLKCEGGPWQTIQDLEEKVQKWKRALQERRNAHWILPLVNKRIFRFDPEKDAPRIFMNNFPIVQKVIQRVPIYPLQSWKYCDSMIRSPDKGLNVTFVEVGNQFHTKSKIHLNSPGPDQIPPKVLYWLQNMNKMGFPHAVFSHYIGKGVDQVAAAVATYYPNLRVIRITGKEVGEVREKLLEQAQASQVDVLLMSNVAALGISLYKYKGVFFLDVCDNLASENQTWARFCRFMDPARIRDMLKEQRKEWKQQQQQQQQLEESAPQPGQRRKLPKFVRPTVLVVKLLACFPNVDTCTQGWEELQTFVQQDTKCASIPVKRLKTQLKQKQEFLKNRTLDELQEDVNQKKHQDILFWLQLIASVSVSCSY